MIPLGRLRELVQGADAAGLQVAVHAIGDRAVDEVVDVFACVREANAHLHAPGNATATPRPAHRIEHAQHISGPRTAARMAAAGVTATPNPMHLPADAPLLVSRLGAERAGGPGGQGVMGLWGKGDGVCVVLQGGVCVSGHIQSAAAEVAAVFVCTRLRLRSRLLLVLLAVPRWRLHLLRVFALAQAAT